VAKSRRKLISGAGIKVVIKTPDLHPAVSRGFYQVEEDSLYVPLHPAGKFFSYLDSRQATFDIDNAGRLLFIQVQAPRHTWNIGGKIKPPVLSSPADVRFLDFRNTLPAARLETPADRSWLRLIFDGGKQASPYRVAKNLIFEITSESTLASIWIMTIEDDRAARGMAAWRKKIQEQEGRSNDDKSYIRIEIERL